ncbi:hypothetical protein WA538_000877, partial [Blastocystis sp. DL]
DSLLHVSPEFNWEVENPPTNELVYCASSIGLNSPVLFHHFLQLALSSHTRTIALTSSSSYEDIASVCKRNGLNVEAAIQDGSLLLLPVEMVESEYINQADAIQSIASPDGTTQTLPLYQPRAYPVPTCSLSNVFSTCVAKLTQLHSQVDSVCLLVDDVLVLGDSNASVLSSVRTLRNMLEDHFTNYLFVVAHPCGLDSNLALYHSLVHLSDVQMLLMPLATGASNAVHGSLVVHRSVVGGVFRSVTLRRHVKIGDNGIRLFVPGEV